jgi:RNA-binding protein
LEIAVVELTGYQRKHLRGLAHGLRPLVLIGQKGLTETILKAVSEALLAHELIKVKFNEHKEKPAKKAITAQIEARLDCRVAGLIGHTAVFYKPHPEPEKRKIRLPMKTGHQ